MAKKTPTKAATQPLTGTESNANNKRWWTVGNIWPKTLGKRLTHIISPFQANPQRIIPLAVLVIVILICALILSGGLGEDRYIDRRNSVSIGGDNVLELPPGVHVTVNLENEDNYHDVFIARLQNGPDSVRTIEGKHLKEEGTVPNLWPPRPDCLTHKVSGTRDTGNRFTQRAVFQFITAANSEGAPTRIGCPRRLAQPNGNELINWDDLSPVTLGILEPTGSLAGQVPFTHTVDGQTMKGMILWTSLLPYQTIKLGLVPKEHESLYFQLERTVPTWAVVLWFPIVAGITQAILLKLGAQSKQQAVKTIN